MTQKNRRAGNKSAAPTPATAGPEPVKHSDVAPLLLTKKQAAARLGISTKTLQKPIDAGEIPTVRVGGRDYIQPHRLHEFVARRERVAHAASPKGRRARNKAGHAEVFDLAKIRAERKNK